MSLQKGLFAVWCAVHKTDYAAMYYQTTIHKLHYAYDMRMLE